MKMDYQRITSHYYFTITLHLKVHSKYVYPHALIKIQHDESITENEFILLL